MRYKASISYDGSKFYGFQRLKNKLKNFEVFMFLEAKNLVKIIAKNKLQCYIINRCI